MSTNGKDIIYIDIDDEITSIIDKVKSANQRIVAVVLPKRATMLQSSVNLKLLKRAADSDKKQVVLITNEAALLPLAGAVGVFVAKTLQSKPEIPTAALGSDSAMDDLLEAEDKGSEEDFDTQAAATKPVGELAGVAAVPAVSDTAKAKPELTPRHIPRASQPDETIELDNSTEAAALPEASKAKKAKNRKLKVPDFNKFRMRLILGAALLLILIIGWILANIILPKATITISTNTSNVNSSLTLNLQPNSTAFSAASLNVPAQLQQVPKTSSQQVATTGQKNEGQTATGSVTMTAQKCQGNPFTIPADVPAGTGISTNGLTFITQKNTSFVGSGNSGGCFQYSATGTTPITAQNAGAQYNVSGANFTVSGRSDVTANGSTSGGTDNIVNIVTQADIDSATQKIGSQDTTSIKSSLQTALQKGGWDPILTTFNAGTPKVTNSANVGDQANNVTVTETINYTMFGVHNSDLSALIKSNVNGQIDTSKQAMQNDGLSQANFTVISQSGTGAQVNMQTTSTIGPNLNIASLKAQIAGKKSGDVQSIISADPGVSKVLVHFSPFWVNSTPKSASKIDIQFKKSTS